jgi:hypothetical protein
LETSADAFFHVSFAMEERSMPAFTACTRSGLATDPPTTAAAAPKAKLFQLNLLKIKLSNCSSYARRCFARLDCSSIRSAQRKRLPGFGRVIHPTRQLPADVLKQVTQSV